MEFRVTTKDTRVYGGERIKRGRYLGTFEAFNFEP
jgi:hypothetical protein